VSFEVLEGVLRDLTLAGTTIVVASGDDGASGRSDGCLPASDPLQGPEWPTASPWVTVVGGTQFLADDSGKMEEVVCSESTRCGVTGGSGFAASNLPQELYGRPAWQLTAVSRYLSENNASTFAAFPTEDTPGYNPNGRAFPDVSMYASFFPLLDAPKGELIALPGTSLSAPLTAAMFTLANQVLLGDGYEIIGYANPMLYWMGENCTDAFNDITVGNTTANSEGDACLFGYPAAPGWDAATGMGSIRFEPFVACAKRYQDEVRSQGLELLPNGTFRDVLGSSSPDASLVPAGDGSDALSLSSVAAACLAVIGFRIWFQK
jgi:tripeptidyl-peptidase I